MQVPIGPLAAPKPNNLMLPISGLRPTNTSTKFLRKALEIRLPMVQNIPIHKQHHQQLLNSLILAFLHLINQQLPINSSIDFVDLIHRAISEDLEDAHTNGVYI